MCALEHTRESPARIAAHALISGVRLQRCHHGLHGAAAARLGGNVLISRQRCQAAAGISLYARVQRESPHGSHQCDGRAGSGCRAAVAWVVQQGVQSDAARVLHVLVRRVRCHRRQHRLHAARGARFSAPASDTVTAVADAEARARLHSHIGNMTLHHGHHSRAACARVHHGGERLAPLGGYGHRRRRCAGQGRTRVRSLFSAGKRSAEQRAP
jgi:hypothetical protein